MELPSLGIMVYFLATGSLVAQSHVWILFVVWVAHYTNRSFIYPLRIRATPKRIPLFIVCNAIVFNVMNAGLNGYYLAEDVYKRQGDHRSTLSPARLHKPYKPTGRGNAIKGAHRSINAPRESAAAHDRRRPCSTYSSPLTAHQHQ